MSSWAVSDRVDDKEDSDDEYPLVNSTLMIFADVESKSRLKVINREVNMVAPATPSYLKWSQTATTFDQSDHPTHIAPLEGKLWWSTQSSKALD